MSNRDILWLLPQFTDNGSTRSKNGRYEKRKNGKKLKKKQGNSQVAANQQSKKT